MAKPTLFIGPMSKVVVDSCIEYSNEKNMPLGLIPSRRQIDFSSGYVNSWTTKTFSEYVKEKSTNVIIQRDHGGPFQGDIEDDGIKSLKNDSIYFDLIHIDPFKNCKSLDFAIDYTASILNSSDFLNCKYEIGTEEAIFPLSVDQANKFFTSVKNKTGNNFDKVEYLVVQFGTKISGSNNVGQFDSIKAKEMINICKSLGKMSKEHNGDYLSKYDIQNRRKLGLNAINIAPEIGGIQSKIILEEIKSSDIMINEFFEICLSTNRWQKWFPLNFNPYENKIKLIHACGHYCFSNEKFLELIKKINYTKIVDNVKVAIKNRIEELI